MIKCEHCRKPISQGWETSEVTADCGEYHVSCAGDLIDALRAIITEQNAEIDRLTKDNAHLEMENANMIAGGG